LAAAPEDERPMLEALLSEEHAQLVGGLNRAIEIGAIDEIISPDKTRGTIAGILARSAPARGRHGNIPL
jgi:acetyl-CoA/propionyl-CoA carboxylase carboxyl transferase subunit